MSSFTIILTMNCKILSNTCIVSDPNFYKRFPLGLLIAYADVQLNLIGQVGYHETIVKATAVDFYLLNHYTFDVTITLL